MSPQPPSVPLSSRPTHPFRRAVLRGLAVVLPPLLTIVIFVWVGNTIAIYVLEPLESAAKSALLWAHREEIRSDLPPADPATGRIADPSTGTIYQQVSDDGQFVPLKVYETVDRVRGTSAMPDTARGVLEVYVETKFLKRHIVVPVFLLLFVFLLYLLGKFLAAGAGRFFWLMFERGINHLPLVRNVYTSVKQVTDFMLSEREIEYTRVVAVEYPRKGIWSIGFVTGDGMLDVRSAANEAVLSVLVPTSPMPVTGYTITVKKSESIDLDITVDQAFQFIVSCGVVVPPGQVVPRTTKRLRIDGGDGEAPTTDESAVLPAQ